MWRQYAPVLLAGFSCGMGLSGMFAERTDDLRRDDLYLS